MQSLVEPSLLNVFRLFIGLRLVASGFSALRWDWFGTDAASLWPITFGFNIFLLLYLYSRSLPHIFPRLYLPVALLAVTVMILLESRVFQWLLVTGALSQDNSVALFAKQLQNIIQALENRPSFTFLLTISGSTTLFVPLVLLSWQYKFRVVALGILTTSVLDIILLVIFVRPRDASLEMFAISTRAASFFIVGYIVSHLATIQRRQRADLQESNRQLRLYAATREKLATTQERNRLARELHDTLAHTMSAATVKLNAVNLLWERDPERAHSMLSEVIGTMNDGMGETRRALRDLRATPLDDMGLVLAVRHLADSAAERGEFALEIDTPTREPRLSPDVELGIYRIVQEALTNVVEHANARHVQLQMVDTAAGFMVRINDDGTGFNDDQVSENGHLGLKGMRERAAMLGGILTLNSAPERGTSIELRLEK
jgi:signal transduction histidine kinase